MPDYPKFIFYPRSASPPPWVGELIAAFRSGLGPEQRGRSEQLTSDHVLEAIRPELERAGYNVERGKKADQKIHRPVLFKEMGEHEVEYQIDAFHPSHKVVLEVEAGRGGKSNALFRDIIRMALMVDAEFAAVALPITYHHTAKAKGGGPARDVTVPVYEDGKKTLEAIYSSGRLALPFRGFLVVGY